MEIQRGRGSFLMCFFRSLFGGVLRSLGVRFGVPTGVKNREKFDDKKLLDEESKMSPEKRL